MDHLNAHTSQEITVTSRISSPAMVLTVLDFGISALQTRTQLTLTAPCGGGSCYYLD